MCSAEETQVNCCFTFLGILDHWLGGGKRAREINIVVFMGSFSVAAYYQSDKTELITDQSLLNAEFLN